LNRYNSGEIGGNRIETPYLGLAVNAIDTFATLVFANGIRFREQWFYVGSRG
jgi:hypothetical protein